MRCTRNLSNNLFRLRKYQGQSLVSFSQQLGISKSTLQAIEQGHSPRLDTVELIAEKLAVSTEELLSGSFEVSRTRNDRYAPLGSPNWTPEDWNRLLSLGWQMSKLLWKYRAPLQTDAGRERQEEKT